MEALGGRRDAPPESDPTPWPSGRQPEGPPDMPSAADAKAAKRAAKAAPALLACLSSRSGGRTVVPGFRWRASERRSRVADPTVADTNA